MRFLLRSLELVFLFSLFLSASAQLSGGGLIIGALLPLTGADQNTGTVQATALQAALATSETRGITIELRLADSRSDPAKSAVQARTLIAAGVHALICCSNANEAETVAPLASEAGVPLLNLGTFAAPPESAYWIFSLGASERARLERLALETPLQPFALLAPLGAEGDLAARTLARSSAGVARYSPGRTPLTPEALWAATREPASVVIWDDAAGTLEASRALDERGYSGERVVSAAIWDELDALGRASLTGAKSVLSPAALGYTLADSHPSKPSVASFRRALIGLQNSLLDETTLAEGAAAEGAARLLVSAAEQVVVLAPDLSDTAGLRQGLRDALIGLDPQVEAGGTYDFSEGRHAGLLPDSLVLGSWRSGAFRPQ